MIVEQNELQMEILVHENARIKRERDDLKRHVKRLEKEVKLLRRAAGLNGNAARLKTIRNRGIA